MEHLIELILAGLRAAGFRAEWAAAGWEHDLPP